MSTVNEIDYSIIICTYNPDELLLTRCLTAVSMLLTDAFNVEVILVDNNSQIPLNSLPYVKKILGGVKLARIVGEPRQGLSYARMTGVKNSSGKWVIFFDDDNEPDRQYVNVLRELDQKYPHVGAWGPGKVHVDFLKDIDERLQNYATAAFQFRDEEHVVYANQHAWQPCYPFGTGLSIRKIYCEEYLFLLEQGRFSLADRKGDALSSGGDTQMVLFCISKGVAAGVAPGLQLVHIVPGKRTSLAYLKKLAYGTSVCYSTCVVEVFPDQLNRLRKQLVSDRRFVLKALKKWFLLIFNSKPKRVFKLIEYIGAVAGDYHAVKKPVPKTIYWILKRLEAI